MHRAKEERRTKKSGEEQHPPVATRAARDEGGSSGEEHNNEENPSLPSRTMTWISDKSPGPSLRTALRTYLLYIIW
jgi:hypothetical protein